MTSTSWIKAVLLTSAIALAGCGEGISPIDDPNTPEPGQSNRPGGYSLPDGTVFGDDLDIFGLFGNDKKRGAGGGGGIGVNSYLWRASLDTISFMPLASADPFGGVIITDWYTPPEAPDERFKINVYILGRQLRADGLRVALFRQNRSDGRWTEAKIGEQTVIKLENEILARARQLRVATRADTD